MVESRCVGAVAEVGDDPAYLAYDELAAAAASAAASATSAAAAASAGEQSDAQAGGNRSAPGDGGVRSGSMAEVPLELHRLDGTPLDFSSRDAKQESLRQQAIERAYAAERISWGLAPPTSTHAQGSAASLHHASGSGPGSQGLAPRGRGRHVVRPAWLTRSQAQQGSS